MEEKKLLMDISGNLNKHKKNHAFAGFSLIFSYERS